MDLGHAFGALGTLSGIAKAAVDAIKAAVPSLGKDQTFSRFGLNIKHIRQKAVAVAVSASLVFLFRFDVTGAVGLRTVFPWVGPALTVALLATSAMGVNDLLDVIEKGGS